jgi:hypothetical protein
MLCLVLHITTQLVRCLTSGYLALSDPAFSTHTFQDATRLIVLSKTTFR